MDLFEGLDVHLARQQNATVLVSAAEREPGGPVVSLCCAQQVLAVCNGDEVVAVHLFAAGEVGQQSQGAIPLRAAAQGPQQLSQLQQCLPWDSSSGGSCLLFLLKDGATLSLHTSVHAAGDEHSEATVSAAYAGVAPGAASKQLQLLATFHHEGFASLQPADCHILPGPALLLQPEPEQLLLFLPSVGALSIQAAALQGCLPPQQQGVHTAGTSDVGPSAWQLVELRLSAETLLQTLERDSSHSLPALLRPGRSSSRSATGRSGECTLAAVGRWQLLYSCLQQDSLQLLISLPAACAQRDQHPLQQEFVLVYRLQVQHHSAASGGAGLQVASCQALHWQALPSCATVHAPFCTPAGSSHQLATVCSEAGDLQVLSLDASSSSSSGRYTPQGPHLQLPGAGRSVVHLPSVHVSGCSHQDVLAVLHEQPRHTHGGTLPSSSSRLAVTLLKLHGGQLQELAKVQGATGLCAPSSSPLGMLCPWHLAHQQPPEQQQQQGAYTDSSTLRLAAIISLDSSSTADTHSSLGCYAWLGPGQAAGLPGPLLGVLAAGPHCQQAGHNAQAGAVATMTGQANSVEQEGSELQGLQAMLEVLEDRWQQETRELCVLQRRVVTAQRLAAAGHRRLCQMTADTLYRSSVRQFVSPVSSGGIDGALAVYHAGRQLAAQQPTPQAAAAALCQAAAGEGPVRQLLLEVVSVDSKLAGRLLQLQVSVRPVLQYSQPSQHAAGGQVAQQQQQQAGAPLRHRAEHAAVGDGTTSTQQHVWQGPLLQPCHAELLLWHASTPGVPAASSWSWDAISGVLTITASITTSSLLQLHNSSEALTGGQLWAPAGCLPQQQQQLSTAGAGHQMGSSTSQVDVAQAMAAAASRAACGTTYPAGSSESGNNSTRLAPWEVVQVHAAVAVSACCSSQAVAQWEGQRQQQQSTVQWALQQSGMLAPAMALLHIQPFEVPMEQLLLQELMGTGARPSQLTETGLEQAVPGAAGDPVQHTPLKTTAATLPPAAEGAAPGGSSMRVPGSMACTAAAPDVVPPTPCSGDDSYNGSGVIPDSQEGEDDSQSNMQQVWQQQVPQAAVGAAGTGRPTAQSAAAGGAKAACLDAAAAALGTRGSADEVMAHQPAAEEPGAPLRPMASVDRCAGVGSSRTHLLVRSQKADLHPLSELLQSKPCFQAHCSRAAVPGAQDPPSTRGGVQLGAGQQLVVLQFHGYGVTAPCSSGTHSLCSGAVTLLYLSSNALHATLAASSKPCLCALEQLLLLAIKQFPQDHGDITTEQSYLDPSLLARLDAAITSLGDATHLHVKVLEQTLQQLPAGPATLNSQRPSTRMRSDSSHGMPGSRLFVNNQEAGQELSECWLQCLMAQADVDLSVAQLGNTL